MGFIWKYSEHGQAYEVLEIEMTEDGYAGDVIVLETDRSTAKLMDAAGEKAHGVLLHDVDYSVEATAHYIPVKADYVWEVPTTALKQYDDSDDRFTLCDLGTFTSGSMAIDATAHTFGQVQMIGLQDGESDDTTLNKALVKFNPARATYEANILPFMGTNVETVSADKTLDAGDSGVTQLVTADAKVITLPATVLGLSYTIVNGSLGYGDILVTISPNAADKIIGAGSTGTDNKDLLNTKATACPGDYVKLVGDGSLGWYVAEIAGTWAFQA